jgi:catechol 2,3-dioxygenase-like lactoylglutathione lyase family enzyme
MFQVESIDHVEAYVRDLDSSARWYREVLGLEEVRRWHPEPLMIGRGGTKLALFRANSAQRQSDGGLDWHRVAWKTDRAGFEAAQKHLRKLGIKFRGPIDHEIAHSIYFNDPDGHPLEITYYVAS